MINVLDPNTAVTGFFEGIEIAFTIGDCFRSQKCIKLHVKKIDEGCPGNVPSTLTLTDRRLVLESLPKEDIINLFCVRPDNITTQPSRKLQRQGNLKRGAYLGHH